MWCIKLRIAGMYLLQKMKGIKIKGIRFQYKIPASLKNSVSIKNTISMKEPARIEI